MLRVFAKSGTSSEEVQLGDRLDGTSGQERAQARPAPLEAPPTRRRRTDRPFPAGVGPRARPSGACGPRAPQHNEPGQSGPRAESAPNGDTNGPTGAPPGPGPEQDAAEGRTSDKGRAWGTRPRGEAADRCEFPISPPGGGTPAVKRERRARDPA